MAVFTALTRDEVVALLAGYSVGHLVDFEGIASGIENTNFFLTTSDGRFVLTVFERLDVEHLPFYLGLMKHLTGKKLDQKQYFRHTGYMGHERFRPLKDVMRSHPERVIERAVWGMLPKTTLSRQNVKQMLKVYAGPEHPHAAQQPTPLAEAK